MKTIVVYGGRFQPPHKGHKASYDHLVDQFGAGNVYMSSYDKGAGGPEDPFAWNERKSLAASMGIPADHFVNIKNPYVEHLIHEVLPYNRDDTVLIVALSKKDNDRLIGGRVDSEGYALKKDGSRQSIQKLTKNPGPVSAGHFYVVETPTIQFPVAGKNISSASEIRSMYAGANEQQRNQILIDMYGIAKPAVRKLFDKRLGVFQTESYLREYVDFINTL